MLEKNVEAFAEILEDINMNETANVFKHEFLGKSNDEYELGKFNILKHLQNQLNKCTGRNVLNMSMPTSKKKPNVKSYHVEGDDPIFNQFVMKLGKKMQRSEDDIRQHKEETVDKEGNDKGIGKNSKLFNSIKEKYDKEFKAQMASKPLYQCQSPTVNLFSNIDNCKNDLPCFGSNNNKQNNSHNSHNSNDCNNNEEEGLNALNNNNNNNNNALNNSFGVVLQKENNKQDSFIQNDSQSIIHQIDEDQLDDMNPSAVTIPPALINNNNNDVFNNNNNTIEEYVNDEDPGFDLYECDNEYFDDTCKKLSKKYDFPKRGVYKSKYTNIEISSIPFHTSPPNNSSTINQTIKSINLDTSSSTYKINPSPDQSTIWKQTKLTESLIFPNSKDDYYPIYSYSTNTFIDCYKLKFIIDRERTGFEESKDFKIIINNIIAGRYQILAYLGNAAFSKAVKCLDIRENRLVCLKIIENNKDYFDQSLDEIKILRFININADADTKHFLRLYDYFYYKEHLFIVTELLKDNLYDLYDFLNKSKMENYFTLPRIQSMSIQILQCLEFIHSLHLIHCDLKPENILIKSINDVSVKVIDFGSSNFIHDRLSSYIQSRSYRAPEVIMGCKYDYKIDIWSFGCIMAELNSGNVLFQSDSIQSLLARVIGIAGPIPDWMYDKGKNAKEYFTKEKVIYMELPGNEGGDKQLHTSNGLNSSDMKMKKMHIIIPKRTILKSRIKTEDEEFLDFVRCMLQIDPNIRPTATEALKHKWLVKKY